MPNQHCILRALALTFSLACLATTAVAENNHVCSRPIVVGISPLGEATTVDKHNVIGGIYPELLRRLEKRSRCTFVFEAMPRARALKDFENGIVIDVLPVAIQTTQRDQTGEFLPISYVRVALITLDDLKTQPLQAMQRGDLMLNAVRGFDYGPDYRTLVARLIAAGRLEYAIDPAMIARKMKAGRADAAIMAPSIFFAAARESQIDHRIRTTVIPEVPAIRAGMYLSRKRLNDSDRSVITRLITKSIDTGELRQLYEAAYPPWVLRGLAIGAADRTTTLDQKQTH